MVIIKKGLNSVDKEKEIKLLYYCLINGYDISYNNRLYLSNIKRLVKKTKQPFQVHMENYHSELYEDPMKAIEDFLKLKKKHFKNE